MDDSNSQKRHDCGRDAKSWPRVYGINENSKIRYENISWMPSKPYLSSLISGIISKDVMSHVILKKAGLAKIRITSMISNSVISNPVNHLNNNGLLESLSFQLRKRSPVKMSVYR